ncbi:hypothetical protein [Nannocystis pusilla]|uniref:Lipoprotein n=1 Tax=Nannocystis pusilla TaxID=889268 RepID=A0ABS7TUT7_9BACT|nr:hypothetical protein [Nannocystis pusilla]MBZ5711811.1 hypothetical protein [Nannocystis pusilla]
MKLRRISLLLTLTCAAACGDDKGGDTEATTGIGSTTTTDPTTGTGSTTTTDPTTTGTADGSASDGQTDTGTDLTGTDPTGTDPTGTGTTGVDTSQFERFTVRDAAGPCPPNADCDGFIELLGTRVLRVEKFGELDNPVTEVEIDEDDFLAAVAVFTAPELVNTLDGPDPLCNPPSDVFESMELVLDGALHDAMTTACDLPPLVAAREMADALVMEYVP